MHCSLIDRERGDLLEPCNQWGESHPKGGKAKNCISVQTNTWISDDCSDKNPFACQIDPSDMNGKKNETLKLGDVDFFTIELWLKKSANSKTETCGTTTAMPGFSLTWKTRRSQNKTVDSQTFDVSKVLEEMYGRKDHTKVYTIRTYLNWVTKQVRYSIVGQAKRYNMTNREIWKMIKSWKREVIRKKLVTCDDSNVVKPDYFVVLINGLKAKIPSDRSRVSYTETDDDLLMAFDIFSYLTFCQLEAMELQIFYENLLRTGNTPSILQAVVNTEKLDYKAESIDEAQQNIFRKLTALLDLKLAQLLTAMYDSQTIEMTKKTNRRLSGKLSSGFEMPHLNPKDTEKAASMSNHPVAIYNKQGQMEPSAFIPFCSFGADMIGTKVPNMTFPVCDIFVPTVYEGRQCYQFDAERIPGWRVFKGKENGLMLLVDANVEKSYNIEASEEIRRTGYNKVYLGENRIINKNQAIIHIGTLAPHVEKGPGDYVLTSLKQMTGSQNFLGWPKEKRECGLEKYESCQMKGFLAKILQCGCSPFQLMSAAGPTYQVKSNSQSRQFLPLRPSVCLQSQKFLTGSRSSICWCQNNQIFKGFLVTFVVHAAERIRHEGQSKEGAPRLLVA